MSNALTVTPTATPWTYHVVLGDGTETIMEVGPFPDATAALRFAAASMGRTAHDVDVDVTGRSMARDHWRGISPLAEWSTFAEDADSRRLVGYTIERYDGATDGNWSLNGGLRATIRESVAA